MREELKWRRIDKDFCRFLSIYVIIASMRYLVKFSSIKDWRGEVGEQEKLPRIPIHQEKQMLFVLHQHDAKRAGKHFDIRLGDPVTKRTWNWATRKGLPPPGKIHELFSSGFHPYSWLSFEGTIPEGYGAGKVRIARSGPAEVIESRPDMIRFVVYDGRTPEEYIIRKHWNRWLIQNVTPTRKLKKWDKLIPSHRPHYKEKKTDSVDLGDEKEGMQPKIDGAHTVLYLPKNKIPRLFSYRFAKSTPTGFIDHTFKHRQLATFKVPERIGETLLRGELYAVDKKGRAIPAKDIAGMLNASTVKSLEMQRKQGVKLEFAPFDVIRFKGRNVERMPYEKRRKILEALSRQAPFLKLLPMATKPEEKAKMLQRIKEGKEPLTREGVVLWNLKEPKVTKVKLRPDFDVKVKDIFPSTHPGWAGGFTYETPSGRIGRVGSGFTHKQRKLMLAHPEKYKGLVAKVEAQEVFPSGVLRAPVFKEWHMEKSHPDKLQKVLEMEKQRS